MKTTTKNDVPLAETKKHAKQPIRLKTVSGNGMNPEAELNDDAYLRSIYGLTESIKEARNEPINKGVTLEKLDW